MNKDKTLQMLDKALEMEKKGRTFYDEAIAKCKNKLGIEIFGTLALDEVVHIERIIKIYKALKDDRSWIEDWKDLKSESRDMKSFFKNLAAKHQGNIQANTADLEALDIGIDFERRSVEYYENKLKYAKDPIEKMFLEKMIAEEKDHYELLLDTKAYLSDPASWFAKQERSRPSGA